MTAAAEQLRTTTDEAPIIIRPLDKLRIAITLGRRPESSIASQTAFS